MIITVNFAAVFVVLSFLAWRFFPYKDKKIPVKAMVRQNYIIKTVLQCSWSGRENEDYLASDDSIESVDIFEISMKNCFNVGKQLIDDILAEDYRLFY
ncbi:MAG: hypothetical protein IKG30_11390 [Clostridiales bacterium]|nr:hypothetical protein [Clostridiales bacterium]